MRKIAPAAVRYIKLGAKGSWTALCVERGELRLGAGAERERAGERACAQAGRNGGHDPGPRAGIWGGSSDDTRKLRRVATRRPAMRTDRLRCVPPSR